MIGSGQQQHVEDRTPPMTPRLALRVAVVGGVALVMFAVIFFRLWFLQVLNSNQYAKAAVQNIVRHVPVQAPRGELLGLNGTPLVQSVPVPSVSISPTSLPVRLTQTNFLKQPSQDLALYRRLAPVLGMSSKPRKCTVTYYATGEVETYSHQRDIIRYDDGKAPKITAGTAPLMSKIGCLVAKSVAGSEYGDVTIKSGVSVDVRDYIDEHQNEFQGVLAQESYQRKYVLGDAGAQLFGYVAPMTAAEQKEKQYKKVNAGDSVGQAGLESEYDQALRGTDGYDGVKVNAQNQFEGYAKGAKPQVGDNVQLSIDAAVEKVGQHSLAKSIALNNYGGTEGNAFAGAFVAMDPDNGKVYAMGSAPTYNPKIFAHGLSEKEWKYLNNKANHYPLLDNAIQGVGPDGSTFKVVTATAAMESGVLSPGQYWNDPGYYCIPGTSPSAVTYDNGQCRHDSTGESGGDFDLATAIEVSDDDFFFHLGYQMYHPSGGPLQKWARLYGVGQKTGVDLPDEQTGTLAGPKLFKQLYKEEIECQKATGPYKGDPKHPNGCGIADTSAWEPGDNLNTALGQGAIQVTPLQLAVIYAAVENGGTIVTPHLAENVQSPTGKILTRINPPAKRHLKINPTYLDAIRQGLYLAANGTSGTSYDVMHNFGKGVYGKTGTAQYGSTAQSSSGSGQDYAWYACYVPSSETKRPIVVVVWVEGGGFGDVAAAPVARQILHEWYYGTPGSYITGTSTDT